MLLSRVEGFPEPSARFEQYEITDSVAATMTFTAATYGDIEGRIVYDLGCGPGRLAIAAALLGAERVIAVDIDSKVLKTAERNAQQLGVYDQIEFVAQDVETLKGRADTVLMNAPFGVQQAHADRPFLRKALELANVTYSLHKASKGGRAFITKFVSDFGGTVSFIQEMNMGLAPTLRFHEKRRYVIRVDFYRIEKAEV
jgi:putative methylase